MDQLNRHWTAATTEDFLYRIAADYVSQLERIMDTSETSQAKLAERLHVSKGRVSQVLNNPGNLTLKKIVEYARALGKKVAIVAYDDDDPLNANGPVNSEIFYSCWERSGKPADFFALREPAISAPRARSGFVTNAAKVNPGARRTPSRRRAR
jgi:transcriptional regulator with XRE-family HTH domain